MILRRLALLSALGMTTLSTAQTAEAQVIAEPAPPPWPDPRKFAKGPFASGEVGTLVYLGRAGRYAEALDSLLAAAEADRKLGAAQVRETMLSIFQVIGVRSEMADQYRDRLSRILY